MRNITVSLSDEAYRRARVLAAQRDTSVSALVRDLLSNVEPAEIDVERRKRILKETIASVRNFRGGDRLTRDEIHRRDAVR